MKKGLTISKQIACSITMVIWLLCMGGVIKNEVVTPIVFPLLLTVIFAIDTVIEYKVGEKRSFWVNLIITVLLFLLSSGIAGMVITHFI